MPDWLKRQLIFLVLLIAASVAGYWLVQWLTPEPLQEAQKLQSLEEAWGSAMANYGLEPVFPPEEDLSVGDVLAVVIRDDEPDPLTVTKDNRLGPQSSYLRRIGVLGGWVIQKINL